jgi:hypothetical protein
MLTYTPPQFQVTDVPIGGDETVRVGLEWDRNGQPARVHIALGDGIGRQWRENTEAGLAIPHDRLGELVRALLPYLDPHRR